MRKFIEKKKPLLTLHGHIHESARITGHWKENIGNTNSFSGCHDGPELALIEFDINDLSLATRRLIKPD